MSRLIITIGLPGSGKTARARAWVAEDPTTRVRVNRDDLRDMMFGGWTGDPAHEAAVTRVQHAGVRSLLDADYDVVVDDTNLHVEHVEALWALAVHHEVEVWDLTDVSVETCIDRDAVRALLGERSVGEAVIRSMYERWLERSAAAGGVDG